MDEARIAFDRIGPADDLGQGGWPGRSPEIRTGRGREGGQGVDGNAHGNLTGSYRKVKTRPSSLQTKRPTSDAIPNAIPNSRCLSLILSASPSHYPPYLSSSALLSRSPSDFLVYKPSLTIEPTRCIPAFASDTPPDTYASSASPSQRTPRVILLQGSNRETALNQKCPSQSVDRATSQRHPV